jgi:hypothetical protein
MSRRTLFLSTLLIIISTCSLFIDKILPVTANESQALQIHVAAINQKIVNSHGP